jgi:hypothetical protein
LDFAVVSPGSPFTFFFVALLAIVLVAAWVILAASRFVQGGVVERPERVPQLYGYTASLIGLLMVVTSVLSLSEAGLALASPVHQVPGEEWSGWGEPSVTSFEAFRATYDRVREMRAAPNSPSPEPLAEEELRRRYEALRADRIARVEAAARRTLVTSGLALLIGVGLFVFHWRWLRRRGYEPAATVAT